MGRDRLHLVNMVEIIDPEPLDAAALANVLGQRKQQLLSAGFIDAEISSRPLLASIDDISTSVTQLADRGAKSLLIDITSLPKYWFFPMIQAALNDDRFQDIVVTYTSGTGYAERLSENISPLRTLPGFNTDDSRTRRGSLIIGIGFEPLGLTTLLSDQASDRIRLIFPFPPGPPGHRRNWMFVKHIEELTQTNRIDPPDRVHIHMYDCPQVFDALCSMTDNARSPSAIAPYGPKTVSLAMCLFALAAARAGQPRVPVYYGQPLRYAIDYTTGIRTRGDAPDTMGYCLRLAGRDLYRIA